MKLNKVDLGLGGGSLLQVAGRSCVQMMSYVVTTEGGKLIIIDGGHHCDEDALHLLSLIKKGGGVIERWYITHIHCDHYGALLRLSELGRLSEIEVKEICMNSPLEEWLLTKEDQERTKKFLEFIKSTDIPVRNVYTGDVDVVDNVKIEIISHPEEYYDYPQINPTSIMFLVHFPKRSVLFMGDFDKSGEDEFIKKRDPGKLRCDIVQMAHHGQNGVTREFYERIMPKVCLYTAPMWLWENNYYKCDDPATRGKGPFTTLETRRWMDEADVTASYPYAFGDYLFT